MKNCWRIYALFIVLMFLLLSCATKVQPTITLPAATPRNTSTPLPAISREEAEVIVYSLLLNKDPRSYLSDSSTIIIIGETDNKNSVWAGYSNDSDLTERLLSLESKTLTDFRETNKREITIPANLSLDKPFEIISKDEMTKRTMEDPEWFRKYTVTTFSGIGFNDDFTQALVYMEHGCGGECGTGDWYLVMRDRYGWRILNSSGAIIY